jgi:hypothetical protein
MANLPAYDRVLQIVNANETFFATMGQHTTAAQTPQLAAFLRDVWNPWYASVLLMSAHDLTDDQQALFTKNLAEQLVQIRDVAGYRYQLSVYEPSGALDGELAQIAEGSRGANEAVATREHATHPRRMYARR